MPEITSFDDAAIVVYRGHRSLPGTRNLWTIAHENGQKCPKSQVLTMPLESCTWGQRASKSSRDPKTVDYNPRKRPEKPKNHESWAMPLDSCTRGHRASKSSRDPKTVDYSPLKWPELPKIISFGYPARFVYPGSQGIEILPGPENRGL